MTTQQTDFPVPFAHSIAAIDGDGRPIWSQGNLGRAFPLASVTKILTSLATLVAVEKGALELSTPVGRRGEDQPYNVAHLLSHSSGLAEEGDGTVFRDAPGRRRIYTNQGFEVLGSKLEEAIGGPLSKWMDLEVYRPLGLKSTVIPASPARSGFGSAMDLTIVAEELLRPQILSPKMSAAMKTTVLPGLRGILPGYGMQADNRWGLGVEIKGQKSPHWTPLETSPKTFGHFGVSGSFLWVDPELDLAAVFLGEEPFGQWHKDNWPALGSQIVSMMTGT